MHTLQDVDWECDPAKEVENVRKHGVDFLEAKESLIDPRAITRQDPDSNGEERFLSLAMSPLARLLVIVFTFRGDKVRIISARKASASECRHYLQRYA